MYKIKTNEELNLLYIIYLIYYIYIWLFLHVTLCRFIQLAFNLKKKNFLDTIVPGTFNSKTEMHLWYISTEELCLKQSQ